MAKIVNLGSTCYISCSLQLLYSIDLFREQVIVSQPTTKLGSEVRSILLQMTERATISVKSLTKILKISSQQCKEEHRDVQEFLLHLLDELSKDPVVANVIGLVFGGVLQREASTLPEPFIDLSIPVAQGNVIDGLIESFSSNSSNKLGMHKILKFPSALLIHLMRFNIDGKLTSKMEFKVQLVIPAKLSSSGRAEAYRLQSVIVHDGKANAGHYIAYSWLNGQWLELNDDKVSPKVLQGQRSAYLLLYTMERVTSPSKAHPDRSSLRVEHNDFLEWDSASYQSELYEEESVSEYESEDIVQSESIIDDEDDEPSVTPESVAKARLEAEQCGWIAGETFTPKKFKLLPNPGPRKQLILSRINEQRASRSQKPLQSTLDVTEQDCYLLIMHDVIQHISETTDESLHISVTDIKAYIGVRIAQQLSPGHAIDDAWACFANSRGIWGNRWIAKTMLKDEFKFIHRHRKFDLNFVWKSLNSIYSDIWVPYSKIALDDKANAWKGRSVYKIYRLRKPFPWAMLEYVAINQYGWMNGFIPRYGDFATVTEKFGTWRELYKNYKLGKGPKPLPFKTMFPRASKTNFDLEKAVSFLLSRLPDNKRQVYDWIHSPKSFTNWDQVMARDLAHYHMP